MAGRGPMGGGPQAAGNAPGALVAALKAEAPPSNPDTPNERINPQQTGLEHIKAASISLERSKEFITDPLFAKVLDIFVGVLNKGLLQFDGASILAALQQAMQSIGGLAPQMAPPGAPGMGAPPQGGLGAPQGAPPAAPPTPGGPPPGAPPGAA